ncbi:MAG: hypothetical protein IID49_07770 [Proteobacteria bacterium]|nr:hypothetical protein [Pseudomonadota bacterium]
MTLPPLPRLLLEPAIRAALLEDLGRAGDVTSDAVIAPGTKATALMRSREAGVAAGRTYLAANRDAADERPHASPPRARRARAHCR